MADGNGGGAPDNMPALNAMVQYTKDFSFENPNAPRSLGPQTKPPNIAIQVNVNVKQMADTDFEVELLLEGIGRRWRRHSVQIRIELRRPLPAHQHSAK